VPGFHDTETIAVYATNSGNAFRVPTVEAANGFDVHLEAEAGNGLIGPSGVTPYATRIQIRNLTQFKLVAAGAITVPANATGNIGVGQTWNTNDEEFIFKVAKNASWVAGDLLEIIGLLRSGNPPGDPSNDFSYERSAIVEVI
jgi:hypothetical protein